MSALTEGLARVVYVEGISREDQMLATIRHNRARGQHGLLKKGATVRVSRYNVDTSYYKSMVFRLPRV